MFRQLWNNFRAGMPMVGIPLDWFRTVTVWLNGMTIEGGRIERTPAGIRIYPYTDRDAGGASTDFAWNVVLGSALTVSVTPGDVELGPDTVIASGSITGYSASVSATTGDTVLWIWVNVDVENEAAEMLSGTSITALNSTEKKTILQKRIAKVTFADDVPTGISRYQCGNIFIPRL